MLKQNIYNEEIKKRFISNYTIETQHMLINVLSKATAMEKSYGYDLANFSYDDLDKLFSGLGAKSYCSIQTKVSFIRQYIDFGIKEGLNRTGINFARNFSGEDLKKYVSKASLDNKFITLEDLDDINTLCSNAQDYVIFELLFQGVDGKNHAEIINLKTSDVDIKNNTLKLTDYDNSTRIINVPDRTIKAIRDAVDEKVYDKSNGIVKKMKMNLITGEDEIAEEKIQLTPWEEAEKYRLSKIDLKKYRSVSMPYHITEYVIRKAGRASDKRATNTSNKCSPTIINARVTRVKNMWGNAHINPKNIWWSGVFYYTKGYMETNNKTLETMTNDDYLRICERFGYNVTKNFYKVRYMVEDNI